jgi:hypothetical protein
LRAILLDANYFVPTHIARQADDQKSKTGGLMGNGSSKEKRAFVI